MFQRLMILCFTMFAAHSALADTPLTFLSFNVWGGGGKPLEETIAIIRKTEADIISLQEVYRKGESKAESTLTAEIAAGLGFHYYDQRQPSSSHGMNAVLSRYPIIAHFHSGLGVRIDVLGHEIAVFNLHLEDAPYQPYQLTNIPYADAPFLDNAGAAIASAKATRGRSLDHLEKDLATIGDIPALIMGDFNEPSHRDWTRRAASIRRHPLAVAWPSTSRIESWGFIDTYRQIFPDEINRPGPTWTVYPGPLEHMDRIDFIFMRGEGLLLDTAAVVGEKSPEADIVVTPWPSDHRAMLAKVRLGNKQSPEVTMSIPNRGAK